MTESSQGYQNFAQTFSADSALPLLYFPYHLFDAPHLDARHLAGAFKLRHYWILLVHDRDLFSLAKAEIAGLWLDKAKIAGQLFVCSILFPI